MAREWALGEARMDETRLGQRLRDKMMRHGRHLSRELAGQIRFVYQAFRSPATPLTAKLMVAGALAYFILPTDALPDFLPAVGFTDDAVVISLALRRLHEILQSYRAQDHAGQRALDSSQDLSAVRLDLAVARRENTRLRAEATRWRRIARAAALLSAILAALFAWVTLA